MRWIFSIITFVMLTIGFILGHWIFPPALESCSAPPKCPKDLSRALKGCEQAAFDVNHLLGIMEYKLSKCEDRCGRTNIFDELRKDMQK